MIAKILELNLNATKEMGGKNYTGVSVTYKGRPYKGQEKDPTNRFLFKNNPVAQALENYKVGDTVDITFDTDKWKTPIAIKKAEDAPASSPAPRQSGGGSYGQQDDATTKRIARAVALKEATTVVMGMAERDVFSKKNAGSNEFLAETIIETAKLFEPYLTLSEGSDAVVNPENDPSDMEQEDFEDQD